ncbi:MAG: two-component regulator propeller domain-containing protein, partial [Leeuwenhoekiella sp.]
MIVHIKNTGFFILISLVSMLSCLAQTQPIFEKLAQAQGLSNSRVTSIVKGDNSYMWFATKNGLNRYDGNEIKVYSKQNSTISSNDISDLLFDDSGKLWISTLGGGLDLYDPVKNDFKIYKSEVTDEKSISSNQVNTIFQDSKQDIWLGTEMGICKYDAKSDSFIRYVPNSDLKNSNHNSVNSIYEDKDGNLWIGTFGSGLFIFNKKKEDFTFVEPEKGFFSAYIYDISYLDADNILIGTGGDGLLVLNRKTLKFSNFFKDFLHVDPDVSIVRSIMNGSDGTIWIGTDGKGLFKIVDATSTPQLYNYRYNSQLRSSLSGNAIYEIMEDDLANIWIGTAWNGINIVNQKSQYEFLYSDIKGQNPFPVLSLYKSQDMLFMGLDGNGLTVYNTHDKTTHYFNKEINTAIGGDYIQYITSAENGKFWTGTFGNGLINFDADSGKYIQYKHRTDDIESLSYNDVRYIIKDETDNLWVATWGGGLNYFDHVSKKFKSFRESNNSGLNSDNIIAMQKDEGNLWLATFGGGLNLFD